MHLRDWQELVFNISGHLERQYVFVLSLLEKVVRRKSYS